MLQYDVLNLKENPFKENIPNPELRGQNSLIWAGLKELKNTIESIYTQAANSTHKQIILNWGPYGGGKTFAADYFINTYYEYNDNNKSFVQVYLRSPKDGTKATKDFFKNFIDFVTFNKIAETSKFIKDDLGDDDFKKLISTTIKSQEFSEAIYKLSSDDFDTLDMMRRYIYTGLTKTELKKLNLARNLEIDTDYIKFLAAIILILEYPNNRFVLWLDELEDLIYYSPKNYRTFSQILRDLFDTIPKNFTVFMNFTLSEPKESTIEILLGGAIWSRINKKVRFKELSVADALGYVNELLKGFQLELNGTSPFTEEVVQKTIALIAPTDLTPRKINEHFGELIEFARENDHTSITTEVLSSWLDFKETNG
ncbi:MAG: hypothetical protein IT276_16895 [Ignavibacteriaceae bacterium]|nr:hypothetical protein [Ignavibacteriaceae bacterium]HRQ54023.1 hypothetical protein [Ignavibacteriaceae bacterium]